MVRPGTGTLKFGLEMNIVCPSLTGKDGLKEKEKPARQEKKKPAKPKKPKAQPENSAPSAANAITSAAVSSKGGF